MIVSLGEEQSIEKIQNHFMKKLSERLEIQVISINIMKTAYSSAQSTSNYKERNQASSINIRNKIRLFTLYSVYNIKYN